MILKMLFVNIDNISNISSNSYQKSLFNILILLLNTFLHFAIRKTKRFFRSAIEGIKLKNSALSALFSFIGRFNTPQQTWA